LKVLHSGLTKILIELRDLKDTLNVNDVNDSNDPKCLIEFVEESFQMVAYKLENMLTEVEKLQDYIEQNYLNEHTKTGEE